MGKSNKGFPVIDLFANAQTRAYKEWLYVLMHIKLTVFIFSYSFLIIIVKNQWEESATKVCDVHESNYSTK